MIIYLITNRINNKQYIGQTTTSLERRWTTHCTPSSTYCRVLSRAIKKYGKDNFTLEKIADATTIEELNTLEEQLITEYNTLSPNGYNLLLGGNNKMHHENTKKKMSESRLGVKWTDTQREAGNSRIMPDNIGELISKSKKGKSNGLLGTKKDYKERLSSRKAVIGVDINTLEELEFDSIKEASKFFNKSHTNIVACCKNKRKSAYGYVWKYKE